MSGPELRARLELADADLLAECEVHIYRASGPGGQHRNKVSSAVRLHHKPSGLTAKAVESRLQGENKSRALRRLREAIAISARAPLPERLEWPANVQIAKRQLHVNHKNPAYYHVVALALDALAAAEGRISDAAACLDVTSSSLTRFLAEHPKAWAEANRIRQEVGRPPLRS